MIHWPVDIAGEGAGKITASPRSPAPAREETVRRGKSRQRRGDQKGGRGRLTPLPGVPLGLKNMSVEGAVYKNTYAVPLRSRAIRKKVRLHI